MAFSDVVENQSYEDSLQNFQFSYLLKEARMWWWIIGIILPISCFGNNLPSPRFIKDFARVRLKCAPSRARRVRSRLWFVISKILFKSFWTFFKKVCLFLWQNILELFLTFLINHLKHILVTSVDGRASLGQWPINLRKFLVIFDHGHWARGRTQSPMNRHHQNVFQVILSIFQKNVKNDQNYF